MKLLALIVEAGKSGGWALALIVAATAVAMVYLRAPRVVDVPLPGDTTVQTVAREPGVGYDVAKFCADPATEVHGPTLPVPEDAGRLIATRGIEIVNWPGPSSIAAMHFYTDSQGLNKSEPVEMTKPAADCFAKKAGKK